MERQGGRGDFKSAFDFSGRRVVVIGASRGGIGAAIAAAFAQCGAAATITGVEPEPILFEQLPEFDCMVSAANSFGLMDGGVDAAIAQFFGYALQERVQQRSLDEFLGEQLVVTSLIVETGHPKHPFIAHTPTMRVPMHIAHTDHVYVAGERSWGRTDDVKVRSRRRPRDGPVLDTIGSGGR